VKWKRRNQEIVLFSSGLFFGAFWVWALLGALRHT